MLGLFVFPVFFWEIWRFCLRTPAETDIDRSLGWGAVPGKNKWPPGGEESALLSDSKSFTLSKGCVSGLGVSIDIDRALDPLRRWGRSDRKHLFQFEGCWVFLTALLIASEVYSESVGGM